MNRRQLLTSIPALLATSHLAPATISATPKKNPIFKLLEIEGTTVLPRGINNHGDISGFVSNDAYPLQGFIHSTRPDDSAICSRLSPSGTIGWGIDEQSSVVGLWYDWNNFLPVRFLYENGQYTR